MYIYEGYSCMGLHVPCVVSCNAVSNIDMDVLYCFRTLSGSARAIRSTSLVEPCVLAALFMPYKAYYDIT